MRIHGRSIHFGTWSGLWNVRKIVNLMSKRFGLLQWTKHGRVSSGVIVLRIVGILRATLPLSTPRQAKRPNCSSVRSGTDKDPWRSGMTPEGRKWVREKEGRQETETNS